MLELPDRVALIRASAYLLRNDGPVDVSFDGEYPD